MTGDPRHERGGVTVEFAVIAPLLFLLLFGMLEVGILVIGSSTGTNAAREGARAGILRYLDADDTSSTAYAAIDAAVRERLAGLVQDGAEVQVTVRCLDYDDVQADAADPSKPCEATGADPVEVGRDLLEVQVRWRPLVLTGFVGPSQRTDTARMTIVSRTPGTSSGSTGGGGSLPELSLACVPASLTETNGSQTVTCTIHRSTLTGNPAVSYETTDGSATAASDYNAASGLTTWPSGDNDVTFTVTVLGDTSFEPTETFTVALTGPQGAVLGTSAAETITIDDDPDPVDSSAPIVVAAVLEDSRVPNAKVDRIRLTFSESLGSCAGDGLTVSGLPSGYSVQSVSASGSSAVVELAEGSAHVTSVGSIQVSYAASATGFCDGVGNQMASFSGRVPTDGAAPYLVSITSANGSGGTPRRPDAGDTVVFTFTEPMQPPAATNVVISRPSGNKKDTTLVLGLTGAMNLGDLGDGHWFGGNTGGTATFPVTASVPGNTITLSLAACGCTVQAGPASVDLPTFAWSTAPRDVAGNAAPNPVAPPATAVPFTGLVLF